MATVNSMAPSKAQYEPSAKGVPTTTRDGRRQNPMTDQGVWTGGDDRLVRRRVDNGGGVAVLPKSQEHDTKAKQDQQIAGQDEG